MASISFPYVFLALLFAIGVRSGTYQIPLNGLPGGKRTLLIHDATINVTSSMSLFLSDLRSRGHTITSLNLDSEKIQILKYGDYLYDNIILIAPAWEDMSKLASQLLTFNEVGGNLLVAIDQNLSDNMAIFAELCGVTFQSDRRKLLTDHFSYLQSADRDADNTAVLLRSSTRPCSILSPTPTTSSELDINSPRTCDTSNSKPVLYRGIAHITADDNVHASAVLVGNPTSYLTEQYRSVSAKSGQQSLANALIAGERARLVTVLQTRTNSRLGFMGSTQMLTDEYFTSTADSLQIGNRHFCSQLSKWVFRESRTGVLRLSQVSHSKIDGSPPELVLRDKQSRPDLPLTLYPEPEIARSSLVYRVKDNVTYSFKIEEYDENESGNWRPFVAHDVQMEFVMLDAYVRKTLTVDLKSGIYTARFQIPDNYGIFKFRVVYRRPGLSVLHSESQVSVRPLNHNEHPRFLLSAYPYYSSVLSAVAVFGAFCISFALLSPATK